MWCTLAGRLIVEHRLVLRLHVVLKAEGVLVVIVGLRGAGLIGRERHMHLISVEGTCLCCQSGVGKRDTAVIRYVVTEVHILVTFCSIGGHTRYGQNACRIYSRAVGCRQPYAGVLGTRATPLRHGIA